MRAVATVESASRRSGRRGRRASLQTTQCKCVGLAVVVPVALLKQVGQLKRNGSLRVIALAIPLGVTLSSPVEPPVRTCSRRSIRNRRSFGRTGEGERVAEIPQDVLVWVQEVFAECGRRVTDRLDRNPNAPEESFDLTWIEQVSRYSSPTIFPSQWAAKIETHYLGGLRQFGRWEIADIGILVFLRLGPGERVNKVALLQSKRLYPLNRPIREETAVDFEIGFGRLADPEDASSSIGQAAEFSFSRASRYAALRQDSNQVRAIDEYQQDRRLRVYYQFYNPWRVPLVQNIPLAGYVSPDGDPKLGVRIVPASTIHALLSEGGGASPSLEQLEGLAGLPARGWRLEDFIADEVLGCREGDQFDSLAEGRLDALFYRRTGPIAAAIAITIEAPDAIPEA
jgi:hypothetical protein